MTEDTNKKNDQTIWDSIFTRANLQMLGIFLVILVAAALLSNQTINNRLRVDAAADVPGDIEDIGDTVVDVLEELQETVTSAAEELNSTTDGETFLSTISSALEEEENAQYVQTIGLYREADDALVINGGDSLAVDTVESSTINVDEIDTTQWLLREGQVSYAVPMADDSGALVWVDVSIETLNNLLAEGAANEELFAETSAGYALLVTGDNTVIAHYNQADATSAQVADLLDNLSDDVYNEEDEYYEIETDPFIEGVSFASSLETDINEWQMVGAYPASEAPNLNIIESTENLFDASEVGETISAWVDAGVEFLNEDAGWLFRGLRAPIETVILGVEDVLLAIHWSIVIALTTIVAAFSGGRQVAYIAAFGMFAIGLLGLWDLTMTTMAMLLTSMGFCVLVGIPLGIWAARNDSVNEVVRSVLDAMQTIHPFVYLVPIVILFGIGKVPGTIATIIFALPPMVRLTNLGIRQVPDDVIEAARAFGSSDWQLLRDVQIPLAMPSIMAGVNQTLMLSLSMVVIVALIAGGGLGQEIYRAIQNSDIGRAVVSGVAVLLLAVVIDRISQGSSNPRQAEE